MIGQTISHYRILEKLGEGGMGVVYKAEDTTLDRLVALKFLPLHLNASEQDKARFTQEAKAAAALSHPNICTIYGIDAHDGQMFIAMEFVDGETLREKIGTISFKQAVDIGIQVADGLAAAHEKGIVHRDIKPENIMIRRDGIAQIMDFGLAKVRASGSKITRLTKEGSTVGTAGYMSPEQVQGQSADHRSDIFSFGVLLYELFTGQLPFKGVHETALIYEIVNVDAAPMSAFKPEIDIALDGIVLECLAKEPGERFQSVPEVAKELRRFKRESNRSRITRVTTVRGQSAGAPGFVRNSSAESPGTLPSSGKGSKPVAWMAASGVLFLATILMFVLYWRQPPPESRIVRFAIFPPQRGSFDSREAPMISPDGRSIAFMARDSMGRSQIWIRSLSSTEAISLPGSQEAKYPFWSPDSRFLGFFQDGKLKKVEATGGPIQPIANAPDGRGGSWSSAGIIVFAPSSIGGLQKVSEAGGAAADVTALDSARVEQTHRWPCFLPDGKHFLYMRQSGDDAKTGLFFGSVDSKDYTLVAPLKSSVAYDQNGYLLYVQEHTLMAQPFDAGTGKISGQGIPVANDAGLDVNRSIGLFSVSRNGVLVLGPSANSAITNQLIWFDRTGKPQVKVGEPGPHYDFALSPDEQRIVYRKIDLQSNNQDLWILDLARRTESRFTFTPAREDDPVWSPDGSRIVFDSNVDGVTNIYQKISSGAGNQELLYKSSSPNQVFDWSSDGNYVLFSNSSSNGRDGIWVLPLHGDRKPYQYALTTAAEDEGHFSPDARWIAYTSNESGKFEIYIQSFPLTPGKFQISVGGGFNPVWSKNGRALYYLAPDRRLMEVKLTISGGSFEYSQPAPLFNTEVDNYTSWNTYAVSKDTNRFLINTVLSAENQKPIMVVMNWTQEVVKK
ncbi:MAG TPA: protein kinase [Bacteroidota bacterium]|nr:protein kinase [Bacteroidota bacterium]